MRGRAQVPCNCEEELREVLGRSQRAADAPFCCRCLQEGGLPAAAIQAPVGWGWGVGDGIVGKGERERLQGT